MLSHWSGSHPGREFVGPVMSARPSSQEEPRSVAVVIMSVVLNVPETRKSPLHFCCSSSTNDIPELRRRYILMATPETHFQRTPPFPSSTPATNVSRSSPRYPTQTAKKVSLAKKMVLNLSLAHAASIPCAPSVRGHRLPESSPPRIPMY